MSDVDRLSNSGLYPALPMADKKNDKGQSSGHSGKPPPQPPAAKSDANSPRPPKSIIDEYA